MCILCLVQRWSRRVAAMLPWLVVPLVALWALSQLLPRGLRFEVTSPRLACVLVLLATLFWYEVLVPQLSLWRARRSARIRDRRFSQAVELQKLRKAATRRCRNCLHPYRDQNPPAGARFTCSACGHLSRRPVLDLPPAPVLDLPHGHGWICAAQDWLDLRCLRRILSKEDGSEIENGKASSSDKGESSSESKAERARRKAEEKRQARLEKEMLEEEERKQREEVARLIEDRRKLRDEVMEAEKESLRRSEKEAEKRRKKDKDKGSSKSNSDAEELEKKASRECEGKREFDKCERPKVSRPRGFNQASILGRNSHASAASVGKVGKPGNGFVDRGRASGIRKEAQSFGKIASGGDAKKPATNVRRILDVQPGPIVQKKSWLQLFARSSAVSPCPDENTTNRLNNGSRLEAQSVCLTDHKVLPNYCSRLEMQSLPSTTYPSVSSTAYPSVSCSLDRNSVSCLGDGYLSPRMKHSGIGSISEDADIFEDPCFIPDHVSLLGPVSGSLDNFPLDYNMEEVGFRKNVPSHVPSPIEPPLSRLRASEERQSVPGVISQDLRGSSLNESGSTPEQGIWQMWGTPLAHDGLGLVGGPNWLLQLAQNKPKLEDAVHTLPQNPMISHIATENNVFPGTKTPQNVRTGEYRNGVASLDPVPNGNDPWAQRTLFPPLPFDGGTRSFPFSQMDNLAQNDLACDTPNSSASSNISEPSPVNFWHKRDCTSPGPEEVGGNSPFARTWIGGSSPSNDPHVQPPGRSFS